MQQRRVSSGDTGRRRHRRRCRRRRRCRWRRRRRRRDVGSHSTFIFSLLLQIFLFRRSCISLLKIKLLDDQK